MKRQRNLTRCIFCGAPVIADTTRRGQSGAVEPDTLADHECPTRRQVRRRVAPTALVQAEYIRVMGTFGENRP